MRSGDEAVFAALTEPYRRQLQVHCYRMLGSFDEAEDLVQETLLRAWRGRAGFEGRASVRTWLYRIATNACLDVLESKSYRLRSLESPQSADSYGPDWLEPFPDRLLDQVASTEAGPAALIIWSETLHLPLPPPLPYLTSKDLAVLRFRDH